MPFNLIGNEDNGFSFKKKENTEYITNGMMLRIDGIDNTKSGHSTTSTKWEDLSGNGNDFKLTYCKWDNNSLVTNSNNSYCLGTQLNPTQLTLEAVFKPSKVPTSGIISVVSNIEAGGYCFQRPNNATKLNFVVHIGSGYIFAPICEYTANQLIRVVATVSTDTIKVYKDNQLITSQTYTGAIKSPNGNTVLALGCNPFGSNNGNGSSPYYKGNIYAVRLYNRALTEKELTNNYKLDTKRFFK